MKRWSKAVYIKKIYTCIETPWSEGWCPKSFGWRWGRLWRSIIVVVNSAWEATDSSQGMTVEGTVFLLEEKVTMFVNKSHNGTGTKYRGNAGRYLDIFWPAIFLTEGRMTNICWLAFLTVISLRISRNCSFKLRCKQKTSGNVRNPERKWSCKLELVVGKDDCAQCRRQSCESKNLELSGTSWFRSTIPQDIF